MANTTPLNNENSAPTNTARLSALATHSRRRKREKSKILRRIQLIAHTQILFRWILSDECSTPAIDFRFTGRAENFRYGAQISVLELKHTIDLFTIQNDIYKGRCIRIEKIYVALFLGVINFKPCRSVLYVGARIHTVDLNHQFRAVLLKQLIEFLQLRAVNQHR